MTNLWELTAGERNKAINDEVDRQNQLGIAASNVDIDKAKEDAAQKKLLEYLDANGMLHGYKNVNELLGEFGL